MFPLPRTGNEVQVSPAKEGEGKAKEDVEGHVGLDTPEPDNGSESDECTGIPELFRSGANVERPVSTRLGCDVVSTRSDDFWYY